MTEATDIGSTGRIASGRRWAMVLGVAVAVIALDQLSKRWALDRLSTGDVVDLIGSLRFKLAFNTGMAFSKGSGSGAIIGTVALGIVVVLALVARKVESKVQLVLIGIVMGGALGNIIDRLSRVGEVNPFTRETATGFMSGAVVDFIDLQWWPVFNIADAAVVCGGIALAVLSSRAPAGEQAPPVDDAPADDDPAASDPLSDDSDAPRP
jgi:signal peptidase II